MAHHWPVVAAFLSSPAVGFKREMTPNVLNVTFHTDAEFHFSFDKDDTRFSI